jgi:hypothetical protein
VDGRSILFLSTDPFDQLRKKLAQQIWNALSVPHLFVPDSSGLGMILISVYAEGYHATGSALNSMGDQAEA